MRLKKPIVLILIALGILVATGRILPRFMDAAYLSIKSETAAFDLSGLKDGSYTGSAFLLPVSVKVELTVTGGRLASIKLVRHFNGQGKAAEAIVAKVLDEQSLNVDAISGATHSSLVILEALRDALSKGAKK